tara:strand:- start:41246 stop:41389 length:144 start_codon:yes stop_codon:yes gene_type:complete
MQAVTSIDEARNWFLSNSSGSVTCKHGEHERVCESYIEAEEFFKEFS